MDSHTATDPAALTAAFAGMGFALVFVLILLIFSVFIYWKIATKAGYNGAMSLLLFVPLVNLIVIVMFAFTEWPIQRELNMYRTGGGGGGFGGGGGLGGGGMVPPAWPPAQPPPSAGPYLPPGA